jgi:hypothetical protein
MCDIQIVTGLGILVSGFTNLRCGISAYHFQIIVHLAWFSSLTHLCALTALRRHFHRHQVEKSVRLLLMIVLAIMLIAALAPTAFFNWTHTEEPAASTAEAYAICFFDRQLALRWYNGTICRNETSELPQSRATSTPDDNGSTCSYHAFKNTSALQSVVVSIILLVMSLTSRSIKLYPSSSAEAVSWRKRCSAHWRSSMRKNGRRGQEPKQFCRGLSSVARCWRWRWRDYTQICSLPRSLM